MQVIQLMYACCLWFKSELLEVVDFHIMCMLQVLQQSIQLRTSFAGSVYRTQPRAGLQYILGADGCQV